jgi:predicted Zn-ribbon and HTH transcriptional regulator
MTSNYTIIYEEFRCYQCGTFWAIEVTRKPGTCVCPRCAAKSIEAANMAADKSERSARSLRGALKRSKKQ